ncbi:MAG: hypothetical protein KC486_23435 [Myxococcales bacterium]|nr:hypothetical protein [Myxococcales bacterium]
MPAHAHDVDPLADYGLDYRVDDPSAPSTDDLDARAGDRYVRARDPLRARVAAGEREADVRLGVDPGDFFCGDHFANLLALRRRRGDLRVGFVHAPPDRRCGPLGAAAAHLFDREANLEQLAKVVAVALRGLTPATGGVVLLTGFGPFARSPDNPTAAFVAASASLDRSVATAFPGASRVGAWERLGPRLRGLSYDLPALADGRRRLHLAAVTLALAQSTADACAGLYLSHETVDATLLAAVTALPRPPAAILGLGVDSGQLLGAERPTFKVETQTRGWHQGGRRGANATDAFQRGLDLARIFMAARDRREGPLRFLDD